MVSLQSLIVLVVVSIHISECQRGAYRNSGNTLSRSQRNKAVYQRCVNMAARRLNNKRLSARLERALGRRAFAQCMSAKRRRLLQRTDRSRWPQCTSTLRRRRIPCRRRRTAVDWRVECVDVRDDCEALRNVHAFCHLDAVKTACRRTCDECVDTVIGEPWLSWDLPPPDYTVTLGRKDVVPHKMNTCSAFDNVDNAAHFDCSGGGCDQFFERPFMAICRERACKQQCYVLQCCREYGRLPPRTPPPVAAFWAEVDLPPPTATVYRCGMVFTEHKDNTCFFVAMHPERFDCSAVGSGCDDTGQWPGHPMWDLGAKCACSECKQQCYVMMCCYEHDLLPHTEGIASMSAGHTLWML